MEIPRMPLPFKADSSRSFEDYMSQDVPTTSSEASSAAFTLATQDSAVMLIGRNKVASDLEGAGVGKISAEEANQRFPDIQTPFREPVNPYIAQLQYDKQKNDMELQRKIELGPQDPWTKAKVFGAGILAHLMDPLETSANLLLGWGVGGIAAKGAFGAKIAGAAAKVTAGTAGIGTRVGVDVLESGVGNLIQNIPQEALLAKTTIKEGGNYDPETGSFLTDLAMNSFGVAAGMAGAKEVIRGSLKGMGSFYRMLRNTSPQADLAIARTVVGNMSNDVRPNITPILETLAKETSVKPQDFGLPHYQFDRVTPENIANKKFYVSTVDSVHSFDKGIKTSLGDDFSMGTHLTDNPAVANVAAARGMADNLGAVHEVSVSDLKPVSLDAPVPENLQNLLKQTNLPPESPLRDVLGYIQNMVDEGDLPDNHMDLVKKEILDSGYNSLVSDGTKHIGVDHTPHNHITVLDDSMIKQTNVFSPEPSVRPEIQHETIQKAMEHTQDYRNHTLVDSTKFDEMMKSLEETPGQKLETAKLKDNVQENIDSINELNKQKLLSSDEVKMFESLQQEFKDLDVKHTLVKAIASCVGG